MKRAFREFCSPGMLRVSALAVTGVLAVGALLAAGMAYGNYLAFQVWRYKPLGVSVDQHDLADVYFVGLLVGASGVLAVVAVFAGLGYVLRRVRPDQLADAGQS